MGKVFDDLEAFVADLERRDVGWNELAASYHEALCKLHEREKLLREIDAFMSFRPVVPAEQTKKIQQSIREALGDE